MDIGSYYRIEDVVPAPFVQLDTVTATDTTFPVPSTTTNANTSTATDVNDRRYWEEVETEAQQREKKNRLAALFLIPGLDLWNGGKIMRSEKPKKDLMRKEWRVYLDKGKEKDTEKREIEKEKKGDELEDKEKFAGEGEGGILNKNSSVESEDIESTRSNVKNNDELPSTKNKANEQEEGNKIEGDEKEKEEKEKESESENEGKSSSALTRPTTSAPKKKKISRKETEKKKKEKEMDAIIKHMGMKKKK